MGNDGFMKHCLDAASAASTAKKLSSFHDPIPHYNVKHFTAVYLGEPLAGDVMNITCWQRIDNVIAIEATIKSLVVSRCVATFHSTRPCNYETQILLDLEEKMTSRRKEIAIQTVNFATSPMTGPIDFGII